MGFVTRMTTMFGLRRGEAMRKRAFPSEPQMHQRRSEIGESLYDYYSHSGREEVVRYRDLPEKWLANYPQERHAEWLRRFQSKESDSHESAFFELFLHKYLRRFCDNIEIEGAISDSGMQADFVLHFGASESLALEALSLQPSEFVVDENVRRVNEYVRQVKSADFSIWFGKSEGVLEQAPRKSVVQQWARRVLVQHDWENANMTFQQTGELCLPVDRLRLDGWEVEAKVCLWTGHNREERGALGVLAGGQSGGYTVPSVVRDKVLKKVLAKKRARTSVPFVLAVNVTDQMWSVGEEELQVLHGFKPRALIAPVTRADGTVAYSGEGVFSSEGTEGVWSTIQNESQYERCSAVWFFHQVGVVHPRGVRQALYLNPHSEHRFRTHVLQHYSIAGVGIPE